MSSTQTTTSKSFEDWQNLVISRVLQPNDPKQPKYVYLKAFVDELVEESGKDAQSTCFQQDLIDQILVSRLSIDLSEPHPELTNDVVGEIRVPHFDYLLACWRRAYEIQRNIKEKSKNISQEELNQRLGVLDKLLSLCVSYAGLVLQIPDMFPQLQGQQQLGPAQLASKFLAGSDSPDGLPTEFFRQFCSRFMDDNLDTILGPALMAVSRGLLSHTILDNVRPYFQMLHHFCDDPVNAHLLSILPEMDPSDSTAVDIEIKSILGPYLRLSAFPDSAPSVSEQLFKDVETRGEANMESSKSSLRGTVRMWQNQLFDLTNKIVRSNPSAREHVLSYFAHILRLNIPRARTHVEPGTVATDGFMHNISSVLLKFCEPFIDSDASKINKIDIDYLRKSDRIQIKDDTKINATQEESDAYYLDSYKKSDGHNFITESFFLTLTFLHQGPIRNYVQFNEFMRNYNEAKTQLDMLEQQAQQTANSPEGVMIGLAAKRLRAQYDKMTTAMYAYETMLLDEDMLANILQFYNLVMTWIIKIVQPERRGRQSDVHLPLPEQVPDAFRMLPEWIMEDIAEFYNFVGHYGVQTHIMKTYPQKEFVTFVIIFLRSPSYIKNPYLKAKFIENLFYFTYRFMKGVPAPLEEILTSLPLALRELIPALVEFYVDVERTGASTQFYDKFNIRYHISNIMRVIWNHPAHREQFRKLSTENRSLSPRFIKMLTSDVTYLLDESLSKLAEIHQIEIEMDDKATWNAMDAQAKRERERHLASLERQTQSNIALGNCTLDMLQYMAAEVIEPFIVDEIVDHLAATLDYNLALLVGPRCSELKVKNKDKYSFNPRRLLSRLIDIYLHLICPRFIKAIARDTRSYRSEYFAKASRILLKCGLKQQDDIDKLSQLVELVEEAQKVDEEEDEELGDAPDEFLDPISCLVMKNPVLLPTSDHIVDYTTIKTHLLGDSRDPFNRKILTIDMVEPVSDLKKRIEEWVQVQREKKRGNAMNTSA